MKARESTILEPLRIIRNPSGDDHALRINHPPRPWLQDLWLWILLVGPLVAPLFVVLDFPVLRPIAGGIYLLGDIVCPKVDVHLMFLGEPLAVCSPCWTAVF